MVDEMRTLQKLLDSIDRLSPSHGVESYLRLMKDALYRMLDGTVKDLVLHVSGRPVSAVSGISTITSRIRDAWA